MQECSCTWVALHVQAGHGLVPSRRVVPLRRGLLWGRQRGHDAPRGPDVNCWWQWRHGTLQVPAAGLSRTELETHAAAASAVASNSLSMCMLQH